jgi:hypothetical protein
MKNSIALTTEGFEEMRAEASSVEEIERQVIKEHAGQIKSGFSHEKEVEIASMLLEALNREKDEGETTATFEKRIKEDISKLLGIELP